MCYDWGVELADIALGDYFGSVELGTQGLSMLIARNDNGKELIQGAESSGFLETRQIPFEDVLGNLGVEFKKHGFGYHLKSRSRWGWPVPDYHQEIRSDPLPRKLLINHPHIK